jgi:hypothetical protein
MVVTTQPTLPNRRPALVDRSAAFHLQQRCQGVRCRAGHSSAGDFFNLLTSPELLQATEDLQPEHRERLYPPTVTLSMFLSQSLHADRSCQNAVNGWAIERAMEGLSVHSVRTGGYCRARQRLPLQMVSCLARQSGRLLSARAASHWNWRGRAVKLVDGTLIGMPDTRANQSCYPQPRTQATGLGFPLMRVVGLICLSSGALLEAAMGCYAGKGQSELALFRSISAALCAGEVLLGDALYCNYFLIALLQGAGVEVLFEQHVARHTDFRRGRRLGPRDHRVMWHKPERPDWMSPQQYVAMPERLTVRELKVGRRILVTTLLQPRTAPRAELGKLYQQRWNVELDLRNIKTTLGLQVLSCKTPQMVQKELWVYLLGYNLIRMLLAQSALQAGLLPRQLSFKHAVQLWAHCRSSPRPVPEVLWRLIAQLRVGQRPGRIEPRARKRRPKHYPWLKVPRPNARWQLRVHGHLLDA